MSTDPTGRSPRVPVWQQLADPQATEKNASETTPPVPEAAPPLNESPAELPLDSRPPSTNDGMDTSAAVERKRPTIFDTLKARFSRGKFETSEGQGEVNEKAKAQHRKQRRIGTAIGAVSALGVTGVVVAIDQFKEATRQQGYVQGLRDASNQLNAQGGVAGGAPPGATTVAPQTQPAEVSGTPAVPDAPSAAVETATFQTYDPNSNSLVSLPPVTAAKLIPELRAFLAQKGNAEFPAAVRNMTLNPQGVMRAFQGTPTSVAAAMNDPLIDHKIAGPIAMVADDPNPDKANFRATNALIYYAPNELGEPTLVLQSDDLQFSDGFAKLLGVQTRGSRSLVLSLNHFRYERPEGPTPFDIPAGRSGDGKPMYMLNIPGVISDQYADPTQHASQPRLGYEISDLTFLTKTPA